MITKEEFVCDRTCAECCKYLTVKLNKKEIETIKEAGHSNFYIYDKEINSNVMKWTDDGCLFLGKKEGEYYCKIYSIRPEVCRKYPFVEKDSIESCKPDLLKNRFKSKNSIGNFRS